MTPGSALRWLDFAPATMLLRILTGASRKWLRQLRTNLGAPRRVKPAAVLGQHPIDADHSFTDDGAFVPANLFVFVTFLHVTNGDCPALIIINALHSDQPEFLTGRLRNWTLSRIS